MHQHVPSSLPTIVVVELELEVDALHCCLTLDLRFEQPESLLKHVERCHLWSQDKCPELVKCLWKGCEEENFAHKHRIMVHIRDHCEHQIRVRIKSSQSRTM